MAFKIVDNILHISSSNGTGDLDLTSPSPETDGYQSFDLKLTAGDTTFYTIWDDDDYVSECSIHS